MNHENLPEPFKGIAERAVKRAINRIKHIKAEEHPALKRLNKKFEEIEKKYKK